MSGVSMGALVDYFNMDGYGFYVWFSYGFAFAVLDILIIMTWLDNRRARQEEHTHADRQ